LQKFSFFLLLILENFSQFFTISRLSLDWQKQKKLHIFGIIFLNKMFGFTFLFCPQFYFFEVGNKVFVKPIK